MNKNCEEGAWAAAAIVSLDDREQATRVINRLNLNLKNCKIADLEMLVLGFKGPVEFLDHMKLKCKGLIKDSWHCHYTTHNGKYTTAKLDVCWLGQDIYFLHALVDTGFVTSPSIHRYDNLETLLADFNTYVGKDDVKIHGPDAFDFRTFVNS